MKYFIFSLSLLFIIIITAAISFSRKDMLRRARPIIIILSIEFITTLVLMHTSAGENSLNYIESRIEHLIHYANQGINFVFGEITNKSSPAFIVVALLPLVFICSLIGLLKHFKILNIFIIIIGSSINRISKLGKLESFAAVNTIAVGMTAVYVSIKEYIPRLTQPQMYTIAACSLSTVDLAILGAYTQMLEPRYVFIGVCLNFFSTIIIVSLINPGEPAAVNASLHPEAEGNKKSFFEMLIEHMQDGFKVLLAVVPALLGFIALIAMLNDIFSYALGKTFQELIGYLFSPFAFLMGIPWNETIKMGQVIATKIMANEFVAIIEFIKMTSIDTRSEAIMSVFLISFSNLGSIAMIIGCVSNISKEHGKMIASNSFRLIVGSTLVSFLSSSIVGIVI
ncbi:nucleoside transporter C-terminal domain-containing protein [Erwinia persicina]|uniref:Nucleoside permease NupC n=1 Tax=Erwinia persicina TaxID=55211 RepID=A0A4U3FJB7_9GAMM|nr:nucleoside transporter C-terminal domain-containing protein [Erwinia persicina]MBD8168613.1 nucleoside permease NupC [Erwinia persicina]QZQ51182.1 nucleoside permease NupC [Erwinia persicina]TKJ93824.1 nucleoside permease NupC [Erwinia persicina]